jgi:hypothetical protein
MKMKSWMMSGLMLAVGMLRAGEVVEVRDRAELEAALRKVRPGGTLRLLAGEYGNGLHVKGLRGTAEAPITIEGAAGAKLPVFSGGSGGMQLSGCSHVVLRRVMIRGQKVNGLNVDDGGVAGGAENLVIEDVEVEEIGPRGNHDGIKLSGLSGFVVRGCHVRGWGGQAVDLVGCREGVIERCLFEGMAGFEQSSGVQMKGGSEQIVVRRCRFLQAGQRPVNVGGSTGRPYFRPLDARYEGRKLVVEDCLFVGGLAGVAFVGCEDSVVRHNTFVNPENWVLRILQENTEVGMIPCRNNRFERNLVVIDQAPLRSWVNVGGGTEAATFQFEGNWWYAKVGGGSVGRDLPAAEVAGVEGVDPELDAEGDYRPTNEKAKAVGRRLE